MNVIMQHRIEFIILIVIAITAIGAGMIIGARREKQIQKKKQNIQDKIDMELIRVEAKHIRKHAKGKLLDPTKRKSLQPANNQPTANGWSDDAEKAWNKANDEIEPIIIDEGDKHRLAKANAKIEEGITVVHSKGFDHKFFGTQLLVGGIPMFKGLPKKLHRLELDGDKVYLNGELQSINPTEANKMKVALERQRI